MFGDMCRLCLAKGDMIWVFHEEIAKAGLREIISVISGVEIIETDSITQMVCSTCCWNTIKMYEFRTTSITNDKNLKASYAGNSISQLVTKKESTMFPPTSSSTIDKAVDIPRNNIQNPFERCSSSCSNTTSSSLLSPPTCVRRQLTSVHPSIREIRRKYPQIQLPQISLRSDYDPYVTLIIHEVDDWFRQRNYSIADVEELEKRTTRLCSYEKGTLLALRKLTAKSIKQDSEVPKFEMEKSIVLRIKNPHNILKLNSETTLKEAALKLKANATTTQTPVSRKNKVQKVQQSGGTAFVSSDLDKDLQRRKSNIDDETSGWEINVATPLVSFEKSKTLHTCNICDSQHFTVKNLRRHQRKDHTKCPFCYKKFRSVASRYEHVKHRCNVKSATSQLQNLRLRLVRVDEDKNILRRYPNAFHPDNSEAGW